MGDDILDCEKNGGVGPLEATLRSGDAGGENRAFYRLRRLVSPNPAMRTRFILIQTSHAGNVGAAARAMKTMGFDDLVLVAPRWANVLRREETIQRASGALDVLTNARDRKSVV